MKIMKFISGLSSKNIPGKNTIFPLLFFIGFLSSCDFVDSDGSAPELITFPSKQVIFSGHTNDYTFISGFSTVSDVNGIVSTSFAGSLKMDWIDRLIGNPFINSSGISLVRFNTAETVASVTNNITQYITQSAVDTADEGSIFVHAMGTNITNTLSDYWTTNSATLGPYVEADRAPVQILFSPFELNAGTINNTYKLFSNCNAVNCPRVADVSETLIISGQNQLQIINTPLGDFEAYRIDYNYSVTPAIGFIFNSVIDFRIGCHSEDLSSNVTSNGTLFVNPTVGIVRIDSFCNIGNIRRSYIAVLSNTTINF